MKRLVKVRDMTDEKQREITVTIASYGKGLLRFIRNRVKNEADAEDILQDVWYRLSAVINTQPVEQVGGWLYRVAKNRIIDVQRRRHDEHQESNPDREYKVAEGDPEVAYNGRLVWKRFYSALEELPRPQRDVFIWHELEHKPFAKIAEITGEPVSKLIMRKHYAVKHLRKRLKVYYDELIGQ